MRRYVLVLSVMLIAALPGSVVDREYQKFTECVAGVPCVFVATPSGVALGGSLVQGATILNAAPTASAANTAASVTLTGVAGQRVCARFIAIKATGAAATFTLTVSDGAAVVLDLGTQTAALNGAAVTFSGTPILCGSTGNNVVVGIGAGGVGAITTTSVIGDRS